MPPQTQLPSSRNLTALAVITDATGAATRRRSSSGPVVVTSPGAAAVTQVCMVNHSMLTYPHTRP
jgi:hypothetical protein